MQCRWFIQAMALLRCWTAFSVCTRTYLVFIPVALPHTTTSILPRFSMPGSVAFGSLAACLASPLGTQYTVIVASSKHLNCSPSILQHAGLAPGLAFIDLGRHGAPSWRSAMHKDWRRSL